MQYQNQDNFPERIEYLVNKLNGPSEFARKTGVTLSTITRWRKGEAEPSRPNLVKIAEVTGVSIQWIATGEEPKDEYKEEKPTGDLVSRAFEKMKELLDEGVSMVDCYSSINVSAGFGSFNEGTTEPDGQEPYSDGLLASLGVRADKCAVFWASGDSMMPTIDDGDQLLVDLSKNEIRGNNIYLVQNGDSVWVKRVRVEWDSVELISDNKEYRPITISAEEAQNLQIIGQVVHIGHSLV